MVDENAGSAAGITCPSCGKENRAGVAFCQHCGQKFGAEGSAPQVGPPTAAPPPAVAPMATAGAPPGMMPPPGAAPGAPYSASQQVVYQQTVLTQPNSGLCVAALVVGIIAAVFFWAPFVGIVLGVLATVFGAIGIPTAAKSGKGGRGMGIAGLVLGIIALGLNIIFIITVWGIFTSVSNSINNGYYNYTPMLKAVPLAVKLLPFV